MVRPKKFLGQHFLKNPATARRICDALMAKETQSVLEIGPGTGVLTRFLSATYPNLQVVELDRDSVAYLKEEQVLPSTAIHEEDFLHLNLSAMFQPPLSVIGNFPYNISSQIVFKILDYPDLVTEMVGMFQKEVADRIVAGPGSKTYGILSVLTAAYYEAQYLFTVEPEEFNPPPKVRSGVIRLTRKPTTEDFDRKVLYRVVKLAFNQRRKTLRNALKALNLSTEFTDDPLFNKRAEQLHLIDFIQIANRLTPDGT